MSKAKVKPHDVFRVTAQGTANIPVMIRKELETSEIAFVCDAKTALLFNPETSLEEILASLEILRRDIELRKKEVDGDE